MGDLDNRTKVRRRQNAENLYEKRHVADIGFVMSTPEGRRVMHYLLSRCGVGRLSVASLANGVDGMAAAMQTYFYEGQRNIGNYYWKILTEEFQKEWLTMNGEYKTSEELKNGRNNDSSVNGNTDSNDGDAGSAYA